MEALTALIGVLGAAAGAAVTRFFEHRRSQKADRERWENHLRGSYGVFLNAVFDYPRASNPEEWMESYRHAYARTVLSSTAHVSEILMRPRLAQPPPPSANGDALLSDAQYGELVSAMRSDVAPEP